MAATIRFQQLVTRSGRPDVYTPWSDPLKDKVFQKARKENRVLTVHQNSRGSKDYGEVGFTEGQGLQFLIFPRSLRWAEGKRVVGIHYEEIADAKFPTVALPKKKPEPKAVKKPPEPSAVVTEPKEPEKPAEPKDLDPLTAQLKNILTDLEKKHAGKAKAALEKLIAERLDHAE